MRHSMRDPSLRPRKILLLFAAPMKYWTIQVNGIKRSYSEKVYLICPLLDCRTPACLDWTRLVSRLSKIELNVYISPFTSLSIVILS